MRANVPAYELIAPKTLEQALALLGESGNLLPAART